MTASPVVLDKMMGRLTDKDRTGPALHRAEA